MTPEQARELLDGATPSKCEAYGYTGYVMGYITYADTKLLVAAPELAAIVAGLRVEYDYEVLDGDTWIPQGHSFDSLRFTQQWVAERKRIAPARIVARYVSEPWEVTE